MTLQQPATRQRDMRHPRNSLSARELGMLRALATAVLAALTLQACGGGGTSAAPKGINGTYLHVSTPDFYFGTRDVGTRATQSIQITNRGADIYPLNSITINGDDAEEFATDILDDVVLNPAEAITVDITFQPITDGRKFADFVVDYDTIQQVAESVNINEQNYYEGQELENAGNYRAAGQAYSDYIQGQPVTSNKRKAVIKLPVINESAIYGEGEDFDLYLSAIDLRDAGDLTAASQQLDVIHTLYPDGYLGDDALYLRGYIELMDKQDHTAALRTMQKLRQEYPDSTYYDTALYSEAIAQQEIGNDVVAREILLDLRYRHTGIDALGLTLPKDNLVSRLWFDRANAALDSFGSF
ncbi:MAG: tetratricopeptide repeat protein [Granulosicoccus sp.]|nr:tetratricopeptide repeat protein [Granulosicoccus sp.]